MQYKPYWKNVKNKKVLRYINKMTDQVMREFIYEVNGIVYHFDCYKRLYLLQKLVGDIIIYLNDIEYENQEGSPQIEYTKDNGEDA